MGSEWLTVGEVARRSGFSTSALRYYERKGLLQPERTDGNQRRYERSVLRVLAFIAAAQRVGLTLEEVRGTLASLPEGHTPTKADWTRISGRWRGRIDAEIEALEALRDGLDRCIGCGCLSLASCALVNPSDELAASGPGAVKLPAPLHPREDRHPHPD